MAVTGRLPLLALAGVVPLYLAPGWATFLGWLALLALVVGVDLLLAGSPKALTVDYSDQAWAQLGGTEPSPSARAPERSAAAAAKAPVPAAERDGATADDEALPWAWPAKGDVLYRFGEAGRLKGIGIGGKAGQAVAAAADGKVVYSGTGLRGYGRLVIVKHNDTYISVYAHNSVLAVKEGDVVRRGQKIAEMGDSDASRVTLHFEVRRFGKPIDPMTRLGAL